MPVLRSSSVQAVRMVVTSMLPLVRIFPEVFSRWRANSPSLRFSWCWRSDGCRGTGKTIRVLILDQLILDGAGSAVRLKGKYRLLVLGFYFSERIKKSFYFYQLISGNTS